MDATDAQDVTLAQAGDETAFRRLVERHSRGLFQLAFRLTGNEPDAEDVVQDAFLKAYRELKRFEARSSFRTWLHRITVNCAYDLLRKRPRFEAEPIGGEADGPAGNFEPEADPSGQPDRAAYGAEVQERVRRAMARLTPTERAAFVLRHFEGRPLDEIGSALGLQLSATKHSIFRAVQKMRRALRPVVGELGQCGLPAAYPGEERP